MPETVEMSRQKIATMLHQLTVVRERENLNPVSEHHLQTHTGWLEEAFAGAAEAAEPPEEADV